MRRARRPRIVVVAHLCPFPAVHGNRTRLAALLRRLRDTGYDVTFILQPLDIEDRQALSELAAIVARLEVVSPQSIRERTVQQVRHLAGALARAVLPRRAVEMVRRTLYRRLQPEERRDTWGSGDIGDDGNIDRWCWPTTCRAVERAVRKERPVAVIAEYALLSKSLASVTPPTLRIIDTVEVFFRNRERFQTEGLTAPFVCSPESERAALARADLVIAIQRNDAMALQELLPGVRVITVSHAYRQLTRRPDGPELGTVLYVGSSNPFNVHGMQQFIREAWPSIVLRVPLVTLRVVGSVPRPTERHDDRIVYVGRVSEQDLAREYQAAHVVINPQVAGTGLKIKCVEALSAGCPLVMRPAGADGLEEGAGTAFLLAKNWPEFADHVVRVLTDENARKGLEAAAKAFAVKMFSPEVVFSPLEQALQEKRVSSK